MKTHSLFLSALLVALMGFTFAACEKIEDTVEGTEGFETVADDDIVDNFNNEVFNDAEAAVAYRFSNKKGAGEAFQGCATISQTETETGRTIVIDYGNSGCQGPRGHVKAGKIIVEVSGTWQEHTKTVTLEDFFIDDHKIEGLRTVTSAFDGSTLKRSITIQDGKVSFPDGTVITHQAAKVRTLIEGLSTPTDWSDDVWETTGSASGINQAGKEYTMTITTNKPVTHKIGCQFPVSGEKNYMVETNVATLDYCCQHCSSSGNLSLWAQKENKQTHRQFKNAQITRIFTLPG